MIVDMIRKGQIVFIKKRTIFQVKNPNAIGNKWEYLNIYIFKQKPNKSNYLKTLTAHHSTQPYVYI